MSQPRQVRPWTTWASTEFKTRKEPNVIFVSAWQVLVPILGIILIVVFAILVLSIYARDVAFDSHGVLGGLRGELWGLRRRVALVLPHWRASTEVLVGTDLVLTVASRTLDRGPRSRSLKTFAPPLPLPVFAFQQAWLTQRDAEPAQVWLRNLVWECSQP